MPPERLSLDTPPDIERRQIECWRQMTPTEKAAIVTGLTQAVFDLARAGIRLRHPGASRREQFLRLALITLGRDLAQQVYPEMTATDLL